MTDYPKVSIDTEACAVYVQLSDASVHHTQSSDERAWVNLDYDEDEELIGIEVLYG